MTVPLDGIRVIHNAFRKDLQAMDIVADSAARGKSGLDVIAKRYTFFNEILKWHAVGEEKFVFTTLENVAPLVAEAYARDHHGLDTLSDRLEKSVKSTDVLEISRATSTFNFFLRFHLDKEEAHLYRIFDEKVPQEEQWGIIGKISQEIPRERFPEVINWLFPLIGIRDRGNIIRIFHRLMPEPAFTGTTRLAKVAIGDEWNELTQRMPELR
jgi:hypothetical protein